MIPMLYVVFQRAREAVKSRLFAAPPRAAEAARPPIGGLAPSGPPT
jgi:hypothetical protein